MALRSRRLELLIAKESTYGVLPTFDAATDALIAENVAVTLPGEVLDRRGPGVSLTPSRPQLARNHLAINWETEFKGSGTNDTPPNWSQALQACGFLETINASTSVVWNPISSAWSSASCQFFLDGIMYQGRGGRGNVQINAPVGQRAMLAFSFLFKYDPVTDAALPVGTYDDTTPPPLKNIGLTVDAFAAVLASCSIDMANEVDIGDDVNGVDGYSTVEILDRNGVGNIDPETTLVATEDWWSDWTGSVAKDIDYTLNGGAGNTLAVDMPACVYREIQPGDRRGRAINTIPFTLSKAASSGDDEITITHT